MLNKVFRNTRYLNISYNLELKSVFKNIDNDMMSPSAPNINDKFDSKELPQVFAQYELSPSFLLNYWEKIIPILIGLLCFMMLKLIHMKAAKYKERYYIQKIIKYLKLSAFNFLLTNIYQSLDDVAFFTILDLRATKMNSPLSNLSMVLAVLCVIIGLVFLIWYFRIIYKFQSLKKQAEYSEEKKKYFEGWVDKNEHLGIMYQDYKDTDWTFQIFFGLFVIRNVLSGLIFALLFEHPLLQTILLLILTISMITGLIVKKPLKELSQLFFQFFCEALVLTVNIIEFVLAILDLNGSENLRSRERLCNGIIVLNNILMFGSLAFQIVEIMKMIYSLYQTWKNERNSRKNLKKANQVYPVENSTTGQINVTDLIFDTQDQLTTAKKHLYNQKYENFGTELSNNYRFSEPQRSLNLDGSLMASQRMSKNLTRDHIEPSIEINKTDYLGQNTDYNRTTSNIREAQTSNALHFESNLRDSNEAVSSSLGNRNSFPKRTRNRAHQIGQSIMLSSSNSELPQERFSKKMKEQNVENEDYSIPPFLRALKLSLSGEGVNLE